MNIDQSLQNSELFSGLSAEHRHEIRNLGREIIKEKGIQIFYEGDEGKSFFVLIDGSVKLFRTTEEGREVIVRILTGGEIFGEVILFENGSYPVSSVTLEKTILYEVPCRAFHLLMEREYFRNEFIAVIMRKQRYLSNRIHYLSAYDVEERFFKFLLENYGEHESYRVNLSKKDFASAIGTIPETFSRLITRLKKRGVIRWEKKEIFVNRDFWRDFD